MTASKALDKMRFDTSLSFVEHREAIVHNHETMRKSYYLLKQFAHSYPAKTALLTSIPSPVPTRKLLNKAPTKAAPLNPTAIMSTKHSHPRRYCYSPTPTPLPCKTLQRIRAHTPFIPQRHLLELLHFLLLTLRSDNHLPSPTDT